MTTLHLPRPAWAALLAWTVAGAAHAGDFGTGGAMGAHVGYRHSFGQAAGGFSFGATLGFHVERIGLVYETSFWNDHPFSDDERVAVRNTNLLGLRVGLLGGDRSRLWLEAGGGLGWVRPAGERPPPGTKVLSAAAQQLVVFDIGEFDDFEGGASIRLGAQQHWQPSVVDKPDVSIVASFGFVFGPGSR